MHTHVFGQLSHFSAQDIGMGKLIWNLQAMQALDRVLEELADQGCMPVPKGTPDVFLPLGCPAEMFLPKEDSQQEQEQTVVKSRNTYKYIPTKVKYLSPEAAKEEEHKQRGTPKKFRLVSNQVRHGETKQPKKSKDPKTQQSKQSKDPKTQQSKQSKDPKTQTKKRLTTKEQDQAAVQQFLSSPAFAEAAMDKMLSDPAFNGFLNARITVEVEKQLEKKGRLTDFIKSTKRLRRF